MSSNENKPVDNIEDDVTEHLLGSVGSKVWNNIHKDGIKREEDIGVQWVKVTLYTVKDNKPTEHLGVTDKNGEYLIENVEPGEYYAVFDPGPDYEFILEGGLIDSLGRSKVFSLEEGETNLTINAPIIKNIGSIKGKVFKDIGIDENLSLVGHRVFLLDEKGNIQEKDTNDVGGFSFNTLVDGKYTLVFKDSEEYKCLTKKALEVTIKNGSEYINANALYEKRNEDYLIEGRVFLEQRPTGILKLKDVLVNGIIVELYSEDKIIKKTLTGTINGVVGIYRFKNLLPGVYDVKFVLPPGGSFGVRQNVPYGSKVNGETGKVKIHLQDRDEIDVNASIIVK